MAGQDQVQNVVGAISQTESIPPAGFEIQAGLAGANGELNRFRNEKIIGADRRHDVSPGKADGELILAVIGRGEAVRPQADGYLVGEGATHHRSADGVTGEDSGLKLERANIRAVSAGPWKTALIGRRKGRRVRRVNGGAAGQQGNGGSRSAVIAQSAEIWIRVIQAGAAGQHSRGIRIEVVAGVNNCAKDIGVGRRIGRQDAALQRQRPAGATERVALSGSGHAVGASGSR